MAEITLTMPASTRYGLWTAEAVASIVGQQPRMRDTRGQLLDRGTVLAADLVNGQVVIRLDVPDRIVPHLPGADPLPVGMHYMRTSEDHIEDGLPLFRAVQTYTIDPRES